jgi:prepilin-type N-terminal cleavage/methylation domain-containing protein
MKQKLDFMIGINFMKIFKKNKRAGFTLIELLVSLFIIALMLGIFLTNYRHGERQADLILTGQLLVSDIRFSQANALGLVMYGGNIPDGGWGVHFNNTNTDEYIIFADTNENRLYDSNEADEELGGKIIQLPSSIEIVNLEVIDNLDNKTSVNQLNVVFLPPMPKTFINEYYINKKRAIITLREVNLEEEIKIKVNFAGLIEVYE